MLQSGSPPFHSDLISNQTFKPPQENNMPGGSRSSRPSVPCEPLRRTDWSQSVVTFISESAVGGWEEEDDY